MSKSKIGEKVEFVIEWLKREGVTDAGDKIPSERYFKKQGVSRGYIREALTVFEYNGWIETQHGSGRKLSMGLRHIAFLHFHRNPKVAS